MKRRHHDPIARRTAAVTLVACAIGLLAACAMPAAPRPAPSPTGATEATPVARTSPTRSAEVRATRSPSPATATTAPASPTATAVAKATATRTVGNVGYLQGRATIGPLNPVERVGVPSPTPPPQVCTTRGLIIYRPDGQTVVTQFGLQPDCGYRVALAPGEYVVGLRPNGIEFSKDLPRSIRIESGTTVRLDVGIDTGIR